MHWKPDQKYAFKFCSPSRSSLQSGRLPVHVNDLNAEPEIYNPKDRVSGFQGIPRNMTGIAQKLKGACYVTEMTGKESRLSDAARLYYCLTQSLSPLRSGTRAWPLSSRGRWGAATPNFSATSIMRSESATRMLTLRLLNHN